MKISGQREVKDWAGIMVRWFSIFIILYHGYAAQFGAPEVMKFRSTHLGMYVCMIFLLYGFRKKNYEGRIPWVDLILAFLALVPILYIFLDYERIANRYPYLDALTVYDWVIGLMAIVLTVEACRRATGWALPMLFILFLVHCLFGQYFPGVLRQAAITPTRLLDHLFFTTSGMYGSVTGISATYVLMFVLLGAVLEQAKGGELFMNIAAGTAGGTSGGPAKAAVIASGLFGSISGSAVANVYATGSFTIPLMIRTGFKPKFAAAVEAVASSSGQLVPPVMGSAAFLIADFTQNPYLKVATIAILPSFLYLYGTYMMVLLEAKRFNLPSMNREAVLEARSKIPLALHIGLCLVVLIFLLAIRKTAFYSAYVAVLATIVLAQLRQYTRMGLSDILDGLEKGARLIAPIAAALFVASLVVGTIELSGLGLRFTSVLLKVSGGNLVITLILVMFSCLVLGMGLPTSAAYLIVAIFSAPALVQLGVEPLTAHFFVFYYAVISAITPPVAVAAYAAASIAGTPMQETGWSAVRLGAAVYLVPFAMVFSPPLVLVGSWGEVAMATITAIIGVTALAITVQGYWVVGSTILERIVTGAASIMLIYSGWKTDIAGFVLLLLVYVLQKRRQRAGKVQFTKEGEA